MTTTEQEQTTVIGTQLTLANGHTVDLGKLSDEKLARFILEKKSLLSEMASRYQRHGWLSGEGAYRLELANETNILMHLLIERDGRALAAMVDEIVGAWPREIGPAFVDEDAVLVP